MKVLNLTNNETSDIKFEVSKFPDGQQQVRINPQLKMLGGGLEQGYSFYIGEIQIKSRLNNFKDLELIICATKSLRNLGVKEIHLYTPYFLGSRSDRKFEEGSNNYLKDVICPIINSLNFDSVTVLDPHSDVLEACLNNFKKVDNLNLINYSLSHYTHGIYSDKTSTERTLDKFILISPDAGANKKIFKVAEQIGYTGKIYTAIKHRDTSGKLSRQDIPDLSNDRFVNQNKDIIIIDDICDGGATFINLSKFIKRHSHQDFKGKIYLIVTHGIFSKGFEELSKYFDGIYCTNSYRDVADDEYGEKTNVKQLNVF